MHGIIPVGKEGRFNISYILIHLVCPSVSLGHGLSTHWARVWAGLGLGTGGARHGQAGHGLGLGEGHDTGGLGSGEGHDTGRLGTGGHNSGEGHDTGRLGTCRHGTDWAQAEHETGHG
jgi:hypothetical protein